MAVNHADKIQQRAKVTQEFILIVIGLGLSGAIIERGFHHLGELTPKEYIFDYAQFLGLALYVFYATRFLLNNLLYLCASYEIDKLRDMRLGENKNLRRKMYITVNLDLAVNVYTGVIVSAVSIFYAWPQLHYLMVFLMSHYAVDSIIILFTVVLKAIAHPGRPQVW